MVAIPPLFPLSPAPSEEPHGSNGEAGASWTEDRQAWKKAAGIFYELIAMGMGDALPKYLATRSQGEKQRDEGEEPVRNLRELVEYNDLHAVCLLLYPWS